MATTVALAQEERYPNGAMRARTNRVRLLRFRVRPVPVTHPLGRAGVHVLQTPRIRRLRGGRWEAVVAAAGRYVLHSTETWYYADGRKKWTVTYDRGRKVGQETFWRQNGRPLWTWDHRKDGTPVWTRYWPNGQKHTESTWRRQRAEGVATAWDRSGKVLQRVTFVDGTPTPGARDPAR